MTRVFKSVCERLGIWDLLQLLAGHLLRYRHPGLQQIVVTHVLQPRRFSALTLSIVNSSIRLRRWVRQHTYIRWRYISSWLKWKLRLREGGVRPAAVPTTFSVLCPSRDRVSSVSMMMESVCRTAVHPERVEILVYVDLDDPCLSGYRGLFAEAAWRFPRLQRCELVIGESMTVGKLWNVLGRKSTGDVLMMGNDDLLYVDYGWDERAAGVLANYPDRVLCMCLDVGQYRVVGDRSEGTYAAEGLMQYPDGVVCIDIDSAAGSQSRLDFPMVTRRWFDALGYFVPEIFEFWNHDLWVLDIAIRVRRLHPIKDTLIDHLHYGHYLAPFDTTYRRHYLTWAKWERDQELFRQTATQREAAACKLRELIYAA